MTKKSSPQSSASGSESLFTITNEYLEAMDAPKLEREIRRHNDLYFRKNAPEISDYDYDRLTRRLKELAPDSPVLTEIGAGPARAPGFGVRGSELGVEKSSIVNRQSSIEEALAVGADVAHDPPMLSLDKCYSEEELTKWADKIEGDFMVTPKMDGVAAAIRYDTQGRLCLAATRGSGTVGENITANVLRIKDVPSRLPFGPVEVRGEIYMRLSVFAGFKEQFSNPRNLAAGAVKQKEAGKSAAYNLSFAAYDVVTPSSDNPKTEYRKPKTENQTPETENRKPKTDIPAFKTEAEKFKFLKHCGFPEVERKLATRGELQKAYEEFAARRNEFDFEIDGVVYKANDIEVQSELGITAHHPRFALAYKFQGDMAATILKDIEWSVSRTGVITPVALIEPVELSGAMVSRASLHNAGFIAKLGLTRGAKVMAARRGGVIPNVEFVIEPGKEPLEIPKHCPSCQSPTRLEDDFLYCTQPDQCVDAAIGTLSHFVAVCEIEGFGDKSLRNAFAKGLLRTPLDFFSLTKDKLLQLERAGEKTAMNLLAQIESHRQLPLAVFLRALGIPELGRNVSDILVREFRTLARIRSATKEELAAIYSFGDIIAAKVVDGLKAKSELIDDLLKHATVIEGREGEVPSGSGEGAAGGPLAGQSFVFTGGLDAMPRDEAQKRVRALGGETPGGVSKTLTHLVCGVEKTGGKSSKQVKAEKLIAEGAPLKVLNEAEFLRLLKEAESAQAGPKQAKQADLFG